MEPCGVVARNRPNISNRTESCGECLPSDSEELHRGEDALTARKEDQRDALHPNEPGVLPKKEVFQHPDDAADG